MNIYTTVVVISAHLCFTLAISPYTEGYYWRDFVGHIPEDAVPGGLDRSGIPVYIGQVLFEGKLVPGKLYHNSKSINFAWDYDRKEENNIQILCSQYPENFKWIPTNNDGVVKLTNKFLVKGGYQSGHASYIGRLYARGETVVGKLICKHVECVGLFYPLDGKQEISNGPYDVLSYNPSGN